MASSNNMTAPSINNKEDELPPCKKNNSTKIFMGILHFVASMFSLYLSFLCNNGFNLGGIIISLIFPYIYIIYKLATVKNLCGLIKIDRIVTNKSL